MQFKSVDSLIEKFVVGKLNIAKNRLYLPVALGGLGLIKLDEFLIAQQTVWLKKRIYLQETTGELT